MSASSLRRTAWFTAAVFAVGTLAVPTLHLILHALPHDHRAGEIHYHYGPASHQHDDDPHPHHAAAAHHEHDSADPDQNEQPFDPRHGEGSLAHFSVALSDSAASAIVVLPLLGLAASRPLATRERSPVLAAHVSVQRFRGPPPARA